MSLPHRRYYEEAANRPFLVARVCGQIRKEDCCMCKDEVHEEERHAPACRLIAEETIAIVLEALESGPEIVRQDR